MKLLCGVKLLLLCFPQVIRRRNLRREPCFHNLNGYQDNLALERWFRQHFESVSVRGQGERLGRREFLKREINPALEAAGFRPWHTKTPLYTEWFLPVLLGLRDDDVRTGHPWVVKRTTNFPHSTNMREGTLHQFILFK